MHRMLLLVHKVMFARADHCGVDSFKAEESRIEELHICNYIYHIFMLPYTIYQMYLCL